jgi:hypothetical protein
VSVKEEALAVIQALPSDASVKLVAEAIFNLALNRLGHDEYSDQEMAEINAAITEADADIAAGRFHTQQEMREIVRGWAKEWNSK